MKQIFLKNNTYQRRKGREEEGCGGGCKMGDSEDGGGCRGGATMRVEG